VKICHGVRAKHRHREYCGLLCRFVEDLGNV
jgi:hypothetical protein